MHEYEYREGKRETLKEECVSVNGEKDVTGNDVESGWATACLSLKAL